MFGVVALSGVVVNDSLVLVVTANRWRLNNPGGTAMDAMLSAGRRRFRPIFLTSITTFCGLSPMIFETSIQAKFLVPMAISIGFGILFATFVILLIVPSLYIAVDDFGRWKTMLLHPDDGASSPTINSQ
jgi:multidrug efflux pump subunit AcrB